MNNIDKLIKQAKDANKYNNNKYPHFIENGYCYTCKGKCNYLKGDNAVKLIDNIYAVFAVDHHDTYADVPTQTLEKIAKCGGD